MQNSLESLPPVEAVQKEVAALLSWLQNCLKERLYKKNEKTTFTKLLIVLEKLRQELEDEPTCSTVRKFVVCLTVAERLGYQLNADQPNPLHNGVYSSLLKRTLDAVETCVSSEERGLLDYIDPASAILVRNIRLKTAAFNSPEGRTALVSCAIHCALREDLGRTVECLESQTFRGDQETQIQLGIEENWGQNFQNG